MMDQRTETVIGPVQLVTPAGNIVIRREVTTVNDWRETPWGLVNFGFVQLGPQRMELVP